MLWLLLNSCSAHAALLQVVGDSILLGWPEGEPSPAQLLRHHLHAVFPSQPCSVEGQEESWRTSPVLCVLPSTQTALSFLLFPYLHGLVGPLLKLNNDCIHAVLGRWACSGRWWCSFCGQYINLRSRTGSKVSHALGCPNTYNIKVQSSLVLQLL